MPLFGAPHPTRTTSAWPAPAAKHRVAPFDEANVLDRWVKAVRETNMIELVKRGPEAESGVNRLEETLWVRPCGSF